MRLRTAAGAKQGAKESRWSAFPPAKTNAAGRRPMRNPVKNKARTV